MRILVIGGTRFVGRHICDAAIARGHELTLLHRGVTGAELFAGVEHITADREKDLSMLEDRPFDAVIDTCGYVPRVVALSAQALRHVPTYCYISSVSVYSVPAVTHDESDAMRPAPPPESEDVARLYGELKSACEARAAEILDPGRLLVVRPCVVAGPHDPTGRFTYWVLRAAAGGTMLVPGPPSHRVQFVDARDLGAFTVLAVEQGLTGAYDAVGPEVPVTMSDLVTTGASVGGAAVEFQWRDPDWVAGRGLKPWSELPLWLPPGTPEHSLVLRSGARARAAGMVNRALSDTIRDTLEWARTEPGAVPAGVGLEAAREQSLLAEPALPA
ncbi:MAG: NAD-dependent epimerase/dehydratase family protein [Candidatus Dormibacteria bacterium]